MAAGGRSATSRPTPAGVNDGGFSRDSPKVTSGLTRTTGSGNLTGDSQPNR